MPGPVVLAAPAFALVGMLIVITGASGAPPPPVGCGPAGASVTVGETTLDAEQVANASTIVGATAGRGLPAYAAVVAVATAFTESGLRNDLVQHDHDSEGLFQIRVGLHGEAVARDPALSTGWFLDRLVLVPAWRTVPLTDAAAAVQRPAAAYRGRYASAQPLATALVAQLWPTARAAGPSPAVMVGSADPLSSVGAASTAAVDPGPAVSPATSVGDPDTVLPLPCPTAGGGGGPTDGIPCPTGTGEGRVASGPGGVPIRVCQVGPWQVDTTIASQLAALDAAATAAGFRLGGGGYRSYEQQVATRRNNCGPSDYDVFTRPSSQCSPPTAVPGTSMHERGLAVDLTSNGALIRSHADPAWQWLARNAASFGLSNLPVEPWHWSVNGR